jgi:hypothetical protein
VMKKSHLVEANNPSTVYLCGFEAEEIQDQSKQMLFAGFWSRTIKKKICLNWL